MVELLILFVLLVVLAGLVVLIILAMPWIAKLMDRYLYWVDDIMGR